MANIEVEIIEEIVPCKRLNPRAFVSLSTCMSCGNHGGVEIVMSESKLNNLPELKDIICKLPQRVRIEKKVQEVTDACANV